MQIFQISDVYNSLPETPKYDEYAIIIALQQSLLLALHKSLHLFDDHESILIVLTRTLAKHSVECIHDESIYM